MNNIKYIKRLPTVKEFIILRKYVGWGNISESSTEKTLKNSLFSVCVEDNNEIIGMGRVIGDDYLYFYIQDIIVHENYRRQGIATKIMEIIMAHFSLG